MMAIELLKYLGLAAMLYDHVHNYVTPLAAASTVGAFAFPFFVVALAYGLADHAPGKRLDVARRMVPWAFGAQVVMYLTVEQWVLNVLFTFALALYADGLIRRDNADWKKWFLLLAVFVASVFVEFAFIGVFIVPLAIRAARGELSWLWVVAMSLPLYAFNAGSLAATVAVPVALAIVHKCPDVPRIKRLFYPLYVLQWPALFAARFL